MKIIIGNDHADISFVEEIISFIEKKGMEVEHVGAFDDSSVDYPDYAQKVGQLVVKNKTKGIVICGTGIGISIAANKVKGIRCANCTTPHMAQMARNHNDANILGLGARILDIRTAKEIVNSFFEYEFEEGRHVKRVEKIMMIEQC